MSVSIKPPLEGSYAYVYVHKTKGIIRVGDIRNAEQIESSGSWNHVSTVNAHVCLENILTASTRQRTQYIKDLLK